MEEPTRPRVCRSSMLMNGRSFRASTIGTAALSPRPGRLINGQRMLPSSIRNFRTSLRYRSTGRKRIPRMFISSTSSRQVMISLSRAVGLSIFRISDIRCRAASGDRIMVDASKPSPRTVKYAQ